MADITNGIVVAFGNTPQAKDDSFNGITEDSHAVILDVMGNDLGGNAKTLWSLDDGTSAGGIRPVDLLIQDTARTEALSSDRSALGATIWITSDGKVGYDVSANPTLVAALQHLAAGQYTTDTYTYTLNNSDSDTNQLAQGASAHDVFTYTMVDSQGATSSTTLTITVTGTNDAPVITSNAAAAAGAVTEAGNLDNGTVVAGTPS